jgi:phosphate transport system substrate-binding protein
MGYLGYTYFEENAKRLKAVAIDSGDGCVAPSQQTAQDGSYHPLSRPLFVYVSVSAMSRPQVRAFFDFDVRNDESIALGEVHPLNDEQKAKLRADYATLVAQAAYASEAASASPSTSGSRAP